MKIFESKAKLTWRRRDQNRRKREETTFDPGKEGNKEEKVPGTKEEQLMIGNYY